MNSLNQVIVEGNLTKDAELKNLPSGMQLCEMSIAVNRKYKDKDGIITDEVSYLEINSFGSLAENCYKWCPKGKHIRIVGRLKQDRWKDSEDKTHSKVKIIAEHVEFLNNPKKPEENKEAASKMLAEVAAAAQKEQESMEVVF